MAKYIIFDTGTLINLTQNGLIDIFRELGKVFQGEFLITPAVKYEAIEHPLAIKRFEWGALRIQQLLEEGIIKLADEEAVSREELNKKTQEVISIANNSFFSEGKPIHLIEKGESEVLALSLILSEKNIENASAIDERTARMLCENPESLRKLMESKLHTKLTANQKNLKIFSGIKIIRSTELMYIANKNKLLDGDKRTIEAVLYALKFGGCSITEKEVEMMKRM